MLDYKFVNGNLTEKRNRKKVKNIIAGGLVATNILSFSGCAKKVPCDIESNHAHYYVNDESMGRYLASEKSTVSGLNRQDNYIFLDEDEENLLKFINKKNVFKIDDNKNIIESIVASQGDYKEYRYRV